MSKQFDYLFKLMLIGDRFVGKMSLIQVYSNNKMLNHCRPVDFLVKNITIDNKYVKLFLWGMFNTHPYTGGVPQLPPSYYRRARGILLVYDITNRDSFDNLRDSWYKEVRRYSEKHTQFILVGNKCDLESKRAVESSTGKEFADNLNIPFIETSAKENINVEQAFVLLAAMIVKKLPEVESERKDIILLDGERRETNNSRCYC
ncbi:Ras-related protein Rab-1A [Oopsacas minuta]|uniref:Ras-related protein Rab-1A n=1 Tax=Oopsacas minuta TaxID=111878 RepID=A0AAV7K5A2_9METZ|nr:Ras-related protein Rab-1A [Oopsacas minuta]